MNHAEALKICRDALKEIDDYPSRNVRNVAKSALRATNIVEPVAASIDTGAFWDALTDYCEQSNDDGRKLVSHIDQHCAAQVAQALDSLREADKPSKEED
jgi:hypothetical protein